MLAVVLVDKLGRKILLISSSIIMCISIVGLGVYFYLDECTDPNIRPDKTDCTDISSLGWLPLVSIKIVRYKIYFTESDITNADVLD